MPRLDHFAIIAPFYDRVLGPPDLARLHKLLGLPISGWLLDAAGGTGRVAQSLRDYVGGVVVVDLSMAMLRQAAHKPGLHTICAHSEHLPFPDNTFEAIVIVDAFHHLCDQRAATQDLLRVLKPGGRLVIEEPRIGAWPVKLVALAERLVLMRSAFYSPEAIARLFTEAGGRATVGTDHPYNAWITVEK
jgi:demethylmenaquinone methyltransferase/2-methoxy-6-polyprenyl-1,4-benzoquinol methylase